MAQTSETGCLEDTRSLNLDPSFLPFPLPRDLAGAKSCTPYILKTQLLKNSINFML